MDQDSNQKPAQRTKNRKLKHWLLHVVVIFVVSSLFERLFTEKAVYNANKAFLSGVEHANPFAFISAWYEYVQYEGPREDWVQRWNRKIAFEHKTVQDMVNDHGSLLSEKLFTRAIPAFKYGFGKVTEGGPLTIVTWVFALLVGLAFGISIMTSSNGAHDAGCAPLVYGPFIIGPISIWILLLLLRAAGYLLNLFLAGPELTTGVSVMAATGAQVSGAFLHAVVKEREHSVVNKLIHFLTGE